MYKINIVPGVAAAEKGYVSYPNDFPHLAPGETFKAWKSGNNIEVETTLKDYNEISQKIAEAEKSLCR